MQLRPTEYVTKEVSAYGGTKLADLTAKLCNEMLEEGFIYVDTIASIQQVSAILLFAKY